MSQTNRNAVKNRGPATRDMRAPLQKLVEESQEDKVTYYDPVGWQGKPVSAREKLYEAENWGEKFEQLNDAIRKGASPFEAIQQKSLDISGYSLPVYTVDELFISDGERSPLVDSLARVAVDTDEVELDEVTDVAIADSFADGGADVAAQDDTIQTHQYTIENQGIVKQVTDKLIHTNRYGGPNETAIERGVEGVHRYLERQALQGTNYDADGFEGLADWAGSLGNANDVAGASELGSELVRDAITYLEELETNRGDIMAVTDATSFRNLKDDLQDFQRFEAPTDKLSFGFTALEFDGVMIAQTHGTPSTDGSREFYAFDASKTFWASLADVSVKVLAETLDTQQDTLVYSHMSLVSQAQKRVYRHYNMT